MGSFTRLRGTSYLYNPSTGMFSQVSDLPSFVDDSAPAINITGSFGVGTDTQAFYDALAKDYEEQLATQEVEDLFTNQLAYQPPDDFVGSLEPEDELIQTELLGSDVTGQSDVFFDYVNIAEQNKIDFTQAEFADLVAKTNAATSNEEISQILTEAGIFHDTASLDRDTGTDMGGRLMDRITITDASSSAQATSQAAADAQAAAVSQADANSSTTDSTATELPQQLPIQQLPIQQLPIQQPQTLLAQRLLILQAQQLQAQQQLLLAQFFMKTNILGYMRVMVFLLIKQQAKPFTMKMRLIMSFIKLEIHIVKESRF